MRRNSEIGVMVVNYYQSWLSQKIKHKQRVCGDTTQFLRTPFYTLFVLCDGIGSGIYANIAAITCANRLIELARTEMSFRAACQMVAASMHVARKKEAPFSAFSAVQLMNDGQFSFFSYESPYPIVERAGVCQVLEPEFFAAGHERLGEYYGRLQPENRLLLLSDGASQAGMGKHYVMGIGSEGIADYWQDLAKNPLTEPQLLESIHEKVLALTEGISVDDTTLLLLKNRPAKSLNILTGPPEQRSEDRSFVATFMAKEGRKVISGSTTADIVARELNRKVELVDNSLGFASPPEYRMEGIDMVSEGALLLNQAVNLLDEPVERWGEQTSVERFCRLLLEADIVTFLVGNAINEAHLSPLFKQVGVKPRRTAISLLKEKLESMGKLVIEEGY